MATNGLIEMNSNVGRVNGSIERWRQGAKASGSDRDDIAGHAAGEDRNARDRRQAWRIGPV
jgi:hypothetical protein